MIRARDIIRASRIETSADFLILVLNMSPDSYHVIDFFNLFYLRRKSRFKF